MKNKLRLIATAAIQSLLFVVAAQAVQAQVYGGRAIALRASTTISGSTTNYSSTDTGQLPALGGDANANTPSFNINGVLSTGVLTASTSGALRSSQSFAVVNNFLFVLNGVTVSADRITVRTGCICCPGADLGGCSGSTTVNALVITDATGARTAVTITGEANQVVNLPGGLGTITINEQTTAAGGIRVNGLHITAVAGGNSYDIVAGTAESSLDCLTTTPTAAPVSVTGRVMSRTGQGVYRALVTITDEQGVARTAVTNMGGYFTFTQVPSGETYILNVTHKSYKFSSQVIGLNEDYSVNIVAN